MALRFFSKASRKAHRNYTSINVAPRSKGTWSIEASRDGDLRLERFTRTGLETPHDIGVAVAEAIEWSVGNHV